MQSSRLAARLGGRHAPSHPTVAPMGQRRVHGPSHGPSPSPQARGVSRQPIKSASRRGRGVGAGWGEGGVRVCRDGEVGASRNDTAKVMDVLPRLCTARLALQAVPMRRQCGCTGCSGRAFTLRHRVARDGQQDDAATKGNG